jgi:5-methyltetrahydrofolate--homocysteine methyltransferase
MSPFLDALHSGRVLLMDGAMGTELQRVGLKLGENTATWNICQPERVAAIHRAYRTAGAEVLLTNTFQANCVALPHLDPLEVADLCTEASRLARRAARKTRYVLADIGPVLAPGSTREFTDLPAVALAATHTAPADAVLLETCCSPRVRYAVRRVRRSAASLPALLSLTYCRDPRAGLVTFSGHPPEWFAQRAEHWGVAALGVNCGRDITVCDCAEVIRRYRRSTNLPLFARPNAGTPRRARGRWVYSLTPRDMARQLPELLEAGVCMVGGCCGTTPEHIAALRPIVDRWNAGRS